MQVKWAAKFEMLKKLIDFQNKYYFVLSIYFLTHLNFSIMHKKFLFSSVLLLFCFMQSFAQRTVIGRVTSSDGNPLSGASVVAVGNKTGARTDTDGKFSIDVSPNSNELEISFVGYNTQKVSIEGRNEISVSLQASANSLNEVVVTALGIKREKRSLTYAVSEVKGSDLTQARSVNVANSLEGKVAGLNVAGTATGAGGSTRITIRGNGSLSGNNQPLLVVDGIPMSNQSVNTLGGNAGSSTIGMWGGQDKGDGISSLDPDNIESVSVLKGGTAAALYGSRASNGAILVTTKSGSRNKDGAIGLEINSNIVAESLLYKKFDDYQYEYGIGDAPTGQLQGQKPVPPNAGANFQTNSYGAKLDGSPVVQFDGVARPYSAVKDNLTKFYNTGMTFTNTVAMSGGNDKIVYRASLSDLNNKGIMPNSTLRRDNASINLSGTMSRRLSFIGNIKYISEKTHNRPIVSDSPGNAAYSIWTLPSSLSAETLKNNMLTPEGNEFVYTNNQYVQNPYYATQRFRRDDQKNRVITSFEPKYNFTDWLYLKALTGFDKFHYDNTQITPTGAGFQLGGSYSRGNISFSESNLGLILGVNRNIGKKFTINAIVGGNLMKQSVITDNVGGGPFNIPFFYDISNVNPSSVGASHGDYEKRINSVYGSADLSFNNYLFLNLTARNDWFSSLTPPATYKGTFANNIFYPSIGLSFVLSDALKLPDFINYAKLRASWAQVGGDTDPYQLSLTYGLAGAFFGAPLAQIGPSTIPNPQLVPLVSTTDEAGLEARFFDDRLGIDFTYYNRITTKDIVSATVSPTSGYTGAVFNVGKVTNKGIELLLSYRVGNYKGLTWEPSFNLAYNKSLVVALYGDLTQITSDKPRSQTAFIAQEIGKPYDEVQVVAFQRNASGQIVYDPSGMPIAATKLKDMGTGVSPLTMGFSNSFRYKSFNLSFLVDAKFGGVIYSGTQALAYRYGLAKGTLPGRETGVTGQGVEAADGKTPNSAVTQAEAYYANMYNFGEPFVFKSDFIKLRSISFGYTIPHDKISGTPFKEVTVSLVARNFWTIKKYTPNIDPESNYSSGNAQGLEFTGLPITKTVGVNVNLKF